MIYEIYYGHQRGYTMFDIEFYQTKSNHHQTENLWHSEIHVLPCVEGITKFLESKKNDKSFNYNDFIKDAYQIQELRGWLYEVNDNKPRHIDVNTKLHYNERQNYIKNIIKKFCDKYDVFLNID